MVSDSFAVCDTVPLEAAKVTGVSPAATSTGTETGDLNEYRRGKPIQRGCADIHHGACVPDPDGDRVLRKRHSEIR